LQRISNHHGRRREVARQTDLPAKRLGGQLFVARHLSEMACNLQEVARQATALISEPRTSWRMGGFLQLLQSRAAASHHRGK
jgi:hypothetical protein